MSSNVTDIFRDSSTDNTTYAKSMDGFKRKRVEVVAGTLEPIHLAPDTAAPKPTTQNRPGKGTCPHHSQGTQSGNGPL